MKHAFSLWLVGVSASGIAIAVLLLGRVGVSAQQLPKADRAVGSTQQSPKAGHATVNSTAVVTVSSNKSEVKDGRQGKVKKLISESEALVKVRALPEVKEFLALFKGGKSKLNGVAKIEVEPEQGKWLVHVYEQLPDHTATMNWYEVDMKTGQISKQF